jgi:hypothetical protein
MKRPDFMVTMSGVLNFELFFRRLWGLLFRRWIFRGAAALDLPKDIFSEFDVFEISAAPGQWNLLPWQSVLYSFIVP